LRLVTVRTALGKSLDVAAQMNFRVGYVLMNCW
jgi:hypothetical protein